MTALDRALDDLIAERWILTTRDTPKGDTVIVAHRPIGWTGPDSAEELVARDHAEMWCLLTRRHQEKA